MRDPYSILGVSKNADEKAIKNAFRKLAKRYHPDQNKDDKNAQTKFAEVNQAYEIIGDKEKRVQYDRGEIDETGKPKFAGFEGFGNGSPFGGFKQSGGNPFGGGGFGGAEDILKEVFGSAFGGAGRSGSTGRGFEEQIFTNMGGPQARRTAPSLDVEMKAVVSLDDMMRGKASVQMPSGKRIAVSIPPEPDNGQVIRLKGQGKKATGRNPGDALITLIIRNDPVFARQGADLRLDLPVPLKIAVLGGKVPVSTPDGKISLNIPAGTSSGKVFRLSGKGLPKKGGGQGDLLVSASIQLPDSDLESLRMAVSKLPD